MDTFDALQKWQIAGIIEAIESLDRGEGVPHEEVRAWARSLGERKDGSEAG